MLLRWSLGRGELADRIETAVRRTLSDGFRTRDLAGLDPAPGTEVVGTAEMTAAVIDRLKASRPSRPTHGPAWRSCDERRLDEPVLLYDTTLRDGTQREGLVLSLADKLKIARRLDEAGFPYIEGGWPGSNPKDAEFFAAAKSMTWQNARLAAFGSTRHRANAPADDPNLRALVEAETPVVTIFGKSWLLHVTEVLGATPDENLAMVGDSVAFLTQGGREVVYDAEHFFDGYKSDPAYALATLRAALAGGAGTLVLCDTNGGCITDEVRDITAAVIASFDDLSPEATPRFGIHVHEDAGPVGGQLAGRGAGRRAARPGHRQRLRRALRQRQHRHHLGGPGAQDGRRDGARRART